MERGGIVGRQYWDRRYWGRRYWGEVVLGEAVLGRRYWGIEAVLGRGGLKPSKNLTRYESRI